MEFALATGIAGLGFFLNKDGKKQRKSNVAMNSDGYVADNIYQSKYHQVSQQQEKNLVDKSFNDSKNAIETNVIPNGFNNNIVNNCKQPIKYLQNEDENKLMNDGLDLNLDRQKEVYSKLTGDHMTIEEFKHNNMVPFFGGTATQSIDSNVNNHLMEKFTGVPDTYESKKEIDPMFKPQQNMGFVYGAPNYNEREIEKIETPKIRNRSR